MQRIYASSFFGKATNYVGMKYIVHAFCCHSNKLAAVYRTRDVLALCRSISQFYTIRISMSERKEKKSLLSINTDFNLCAVN